MSDHASRLIELDGIAVEEGIPISQTARKTVASFISGTGLFLLDDGTYRLVWFGARNEIRLSVHFQNDGQITVFT